MNLLSICCKGCKFKEISFCCLMERSQQILTWATMLKLLSRDGTTKVWLAA